MKSVFTLDLDAIRTAKRGRGASNKTKVFGILKRGGKVYTEIVPDCSRETLLAITTDKVDVESIINTDGWIVEACLHENEGWSCRHQIQ